MTREGRSGDGFSGVSDIERYMRDVKRCNLWYFGASGKYKGGLKSVKK
jgi:hypothetical protein